MSFCCVVPSLPFPHLPVRFLFAVLHAPLTRSVCTTVGEVLSQFVQRLPPMIRTPNPCLTCFLSLSHTHTLTHTTGISSCVSSHADNDSVQGSGALGGCTVRLSRCRSGFSSGATDPRAAGLWGRFQGQFCGDPPQSGLSIGAGTRVDGQTGGLGVIVLLLERYSIVFVFVFE